MDFWQHLNAAKAFDLEGISEALAGRFSELIGRGHTVADLLAHFSDEFGHLPSNKLRSMAHGHRLWQLWRKRRAQLEEMRSGAGLPPLPEEVYTSAPSPDQLDAIVRAERLCQRSDFANDQEWINHVSAGVELWTRCLALARQQGTVTSRAVNLKHPQAADYDQYVKNSEGLAELAPHRWLAMRRGERDGILELSLDFPRNLLLEQVALCAPKLHPRVGERSPESLLQELVLDDLTPWLLRRLDFDAQNQAIFAAAQSLAGLLRTAPLQSRLVGAVYLTQPGAPVAAVVIDREGDLVAQRVVKAEGDCADRVTALFEEQQVSNVALPMNAFAADLLSQIENKINAAKLMPIKIRTAALSEARQVLVDPPYRHSPSVASAMIIARRALDPLKEWAQVDPVSIGVAEYQNDLDLEQLRPALLEMVELCRLERRRSGKRGSAGGGFPAVPKPNAQMAKLNPLVKTINDLKSGMTVHGMVTNISHFGAFVNIGLSQEGLVHISELSDQFVSNPHEVVSIGQQVSAFVLSVDQQRGRISLSLKSPNKMALQRERSERNERAGVIQRLPQGKSPDGPLGGLARSEKQTAAGRDGQMSKAEALANLEKLFKKK